MVVHAYENSGESGDVHETAILAFHGTRYVVNMRTVQDTLCLEVELEADASRWRGEFSSRYIHEITTKTGNHKSYPVFVKMLLSALRRSSTSVCIDLLTYSDLELLKAKRLKRAGQEVPPQTASTMANNKRYLILTYQNEFDKTHYPLPLIYEEYPDPGELKRTIATLRARLQQAENALKPDCAAELEELREDNVMLRRQLAAVERDVANSAATDLANAASVAEEAAEDARVARDAAAELQDRLAEAEGALEEARLNHRRALRQKARELGDAQGEVSQLKAQVRELRIKNRDLQAELDLIQRRHRELHTPLYAVNVRSARPRVPSAARPRAARSASPYAETSRRTSSRPGSGRSTAGSDASLRTEPSMRRDRSGSRPASAPSGRQARFDPTEYVRQKREREQETAERRRRTFSPAGSRANSRAASPSPHAPRPVRTSSTDNLPAAARGRPSRSRSAGAADRGARSRTPQGNPRGANSAGALARGRDVERRQTGPARRDETRRETADSAQSRAMSPGRALQEVKAKLHEYKQRSSGNAFAAAPPARPTEAGRGGSRPASPGPRRSADVAVSSSSERTAMQRPAESESAPAFEHAGGAHQKKAAAEGVYEDASSEIADIDIRLQALQDFLRSAKASTGQ